METNPVSDRCISGIRGECDLLSKAWSFLELKASTPVGEVPLGLVLVSSN